MLSDAFAPVRVLRWLAIALAVASLAAWTSLRADEPGKAEKPEKAEQVAETPEQWAEKWIAKRNEQVSKLPPGPALPEAPGVPTWNAVDRFIAAKWLTRGEANFQSPPVCDDATFARRVYLDLVGRIPTDSELDKFLTTADDAPASGASPPKRAQLIDALLARREDYAAHWVPFWEDALCSNGKHQGGVITKADFRKYIAASFSQNKPYDLFAAALLNPNVPGGQQGYIKADSREQSMRTARDTAQVFMGTALKCASCHNHFLNPDWTLKDFYGYANYFSASNLEMVRCEEKLGETVPTKFIVGNDPGLDAAASLESRLNRMMELTVSPENSRFAKSFVNRLWRRFLGVGLIEPPDDIRSDTPASHPELLDWLAHDFISHGFDVQHAIRTILNSRVYQLAYDPRLADAFDPSRPEGAVAEGTRFYLSPAARRLTCEQVLDSLHVVTGQGAARQFPDDNSTPLSRGLGRPSARNEVRTTRTDEIAVLQSLEFMNGPEFNELIAKSELPSQLASTTDRQQSVKRAYRVALSRDPTADETKVAEDYFADGSTVEAWQDFLWVLLTSPEFHYVR